jgi:hypothetical protein
MTRRRLFRGHGTRPGCLLPLHHAFKLDQGEPGDLVASALAPAEIRARCAGLGLSIDLYQPFRDLDSTDAERFAYNLRRAERKFELMAELGTDPSQFATPGHAAAWAKLTASYQETSGGIDSYQQFWSTIAQVTATEVSMQDDGSVQATISYVYKDGSVVAERTSFGLVRDDGQLKINSSHALSSHTQ